MVPFATLPRRAHPSLPRDALRDVQAGLRVPGLRNGGAFPSEAQDVDGLQQSQGGEGLARPGEASMALGLLLPAWLVWGKGVLPLRRDSGLWAAFSKEESRLWGDSSSAQAQIARVA